jgi:hypothetical protein
LLFRHQIEVEIKKLKNKVLQNNVKLNFTLDLFNFIVKNKDIKTIQEHLLKSRKEIISENKELEIQLKELEG